MSAKVAAAASALVATTVATAATAVEAARSSTCLTSSRRNRPRSNTRPFPLFFLIRKGPRSEPLVLSVGVKSHLESAEVDVLTLLVLVVRLGLYQVPIYSDLVLTSPTLNVDEVLLVAGTEGPCGRVPAEVDNLALEHLSVPVVALRVCPQRNHQADESHDDRDVPGEVRVGNSAHGGRSRVVVVPAVDITAPVPGEDDEVGDTLYHDGHDDEYADPDESAVALLGVVWLLV